MAEGKKVYENSGTLARNQKKEQPNHPDYTGSIRVAGVDYWLNGWAKDSERGKFMSLSVKPKEQQSTPPPAKKQCAADEPEDGLPF